MPSDICVLQPAEADEFRPDRHKVVSEEAVEFRADLHKALPVVDDNPSPPPDHAYHRHVSEREARRLTGFESYAAYLRAKEGPLWNSVRRRIAHLPAEWLDERRIVIRAYAWGLRGGRGLPGTVQMQKRGV
jgi:hypothetical protein